MSNEDVVVRPARSRAAKFGRGVLYTIAVLFVLGFVAKTIWKYSGSNRWELVAENKKKRVRVYVLKSPGTELEQTRAIAPMKSSLAGLVKFMQDPDVCNDVGCDHSRTIERVDDQLQYTTFRFPYPGPFRPRELITRAHFSQNPNTKEVLLEYAATPDLLPPDPCCYRVTRMNNTWRFRPIGNGEVEVEVLMNMDEGGFLPDVLSNLARRKVLLGALPGIAKLVAKPKYQEAKFDFIKEQ